MKLKITEIADRGNAERERIVMKADEDVDIGPVFETLWQRHRSAAQWPDGLEEAEKKNNEGIALGEDQRQKFMAEPVREPAALPMFPAASFRAACWAKKPCPSWRSSRPTSSTATTQSTSREDHGT